jgi:glycosyltransferase involved in cell wall biosynthesis
MAIETASGGTVDDSGGVALSVIAPAYNEAANLRPLVDELTDVLDVHYATDDYEIIIVDDGSSDDTPRVLAALCETTGPVRAIPLARNYGQSAALAAGIDHARGQTIVTIDADLQNDAADIPALLDRLDEGYDCVSGHRRDRNDPLGKTIPSRIQTHLAKATGPDINDFGCTLTAYRAEALAQIDLYGEGHRYIPAKLYDRGFQTTEIEVNHRERVNGSSHYGVSRLVRGFVDLVWHLIWNRYSTRPMHLLGGTGILLFALGAGLGTVSLGQRVLLGMPLEPRTPRLILTALLIMFGLQMLVFGTVMEYLSKLYYRDERPYRVEQHRS